MVKNLKPSPPIYAHDPTIPRTARTLLYYIVYTLYMYMYLSIIG